MIKLELTIPKLDEIMKLHEREIMGVMAAAMQTNRAFMFDKDGADNGKPKWAPLVLRNGRPLQKTGALKNSMGPLGDGKRPVQSPDGILRFTNRDVTIGSKLLYAKMMNDGTVHMPGGVLKPVKAKALKIPLENGKFMFRRSVKIPPRPMDQITADDETEFSETLANYISEVLSAG